MNSKNTRQGKKIMHVPSLLLGATVSLVLVSVYLTIYGHDVVYPFLGTSKQGKWIDLTHDFSEETLYWPTSDSFRLETAFAGTTPAGFYYSAYKYSASEHGGTHLDAPRHFAEGQSGPAEIPLSRLIRPAVKVDVSSKCLRDHDYEITAQDILDWEAKYGTIQPDTIVLLYTGQSQYWPSAAKYLGTDQKGPEAIGLLHFPGLHESGAELLVTRKIAAVGIDTASIDNGQSTTYLSHRAILPRGIPNFENVAGTLAELPPYGAYVIALPTKIKDGSGGPLRIIAYVP